MGINAIGPSSELLASHAQRVNNTYQTDVRDITKSMKAQQKMAKETAKTVNNLFGPAFHVRNFINALPPTDLNGNPIRNSEMAIRKGTSGLPQVGLYAHRKIAGVLIAPKSFRPLGPSAMSAELTHGIKPSFAPDIQTMNARATRRAVEELLQINKPNIIDYQGGNTTKKTGSLDVIISPNEEGKVVDHLCLQKTA